jgi:SSS family solute:Na+ symporter
MAQRILAAKSLSHARWGSLFAGFLKLPVLFIMVLPGTLALLLYPDLAGSPDLVYPTLLFDLLPAGLLGLVFAGFVAALMSQIDSTLNSASTLVTMDFIASRFPHLDSRRLKRVGQWVTFTFMLLAVLWAPQIERFPSLFKYLQTTLAYTVPPVVALFLIGLFWRRANATGAFAAFTIGLASGCLLFWLDVVHGAFGLHFLYAAPLLFALSGLVLVLVSLATPAPPRKKTEALIWTPSGFSAESAVLRQQPWWQNYRLHGLMLLLATAGLVLLFW